MSLINEFFEKMNEESMSDGFWQEPEDMEAEKPELEYIVFEEIDKNE